MTPPQGPPSLAAVGRIAALAAAGFLCTRATLDPDLWGHLRFGLDLLDTHHLTSIDPYSFTQDVSWINHEWLSELLFAIAYRGGGVFGLVVLKTAILGATIWVLASVARRAAERQRWWLLLVALVGIIPPAITFRPQLWTLLGLAVLCRVLFTGRPLLWVPLLFALWANLHGGWVVGVGVAGLWILGRTFDARGIRTVAPTTAAVVAGIVATLANPYGWHLWTFLLSTVRMNRNITEWRPLWEQSDVSHGVLWTAAAVLVVGTVATRWRRLTWASLLPVAWLGISGLFVDRLSPLFCELSLLMTATAWQSAPGEVALSAQAPAPRPLGMLVIDAAIVCGVAAYSVVGALRCLPIEGEWSPDLAAARVFQPLRVEGRLVLPFDWGQYAIWQWGPRLRVSVDGRRETVYSETTLALQASVVSGQPQGLEYLARTRPEYVWLPPSTRGVRTVDWLRAHGYRVDIETDRSFVASRSDLPPLIPGPPLASCFP